MSVNPYFHQTSDLLRQEQLWVIAAQSDPSKFEPLYRKYYSPILRYLQQRVQDTEIAHDLASQVFVKAIKNLKSFEYRGVPFGSWLYRIAKSELYQAFRDQKGAKTVRLDNYQIPTFDELFVDPSESEVNRSKLLKALQLLKPDQLKLIELRFFEQMSFKEIADQLDLTENNAKVKTFRAVEKLRIHFMKIKTAA